MQVAKVPNILTAIRMALALPFIALIIAALALGPAELAYEKGTSRGQGLYFSGVAILIVALITDFIDGKIARKYQAVTTFGKLFDPLADKLITTSAIILLAVLGAVPVYLVIIIILRDILVDGFRNLIAKNNGELGAIKSAQWKTMLLGIGIIGVFFIAPVVSDKASELDWLNPGWILYVANLPIFMASLLALISGAAYFKHARRYF